MSTSKSDFCNTCRICLTVKENFKDIFSAGLSYTSIATAIMECAPISVIPGDGLPSYICHECLQKLKEVLGFRTLCIQSDVELRKTLNETKIKREKTPVDQNEVSIKRQNTPVAQVDDDFDNLWSSSDDEEDSLLKIDASTARPDFRTSGKRRTIKLKRRQYICDTCNKMFKRKSDLERHIRKHTGERPYKCDICHKAFTQIANLNTHKRTHSGEQPYQCNVCTKRFTFKTALIIHNRVHSGEKPYQCEICSKTFISSSRLSQHKRFHSDEKPYACDTCSLRFRQISSLKVHKLTHTGVKPFQCSVCKKNFSVSFNLMRHMRTHTGEKPFQCNLCRKRFTASYNLMRHMRTHTAEKNDENMTRRSPLVMKLEVVSDRMYAQVSLCAFLKDITLDQTMGI